MGSLFVVKLGIVLEGKEILLVDFEGWEVEYEFEFEIVRFFVDGDENIIMNS